MRSATRAEGRAAAALGTQRVHRERGERAPDLVPVKLPCGVALGPEVKLRRKLPALCVRGLEQALGYFRGSAIPVVVMFERGADKRGIVALHLDSFVRLVGLDVAALPRPTPLHRPSTKQLDLFGGHA